MWLVVKKEIRELLRDRKTLFFMIALPLLLFPLIFGAVTYFTSKAFQDAENEVLKYALIGAQFSPELTDKLARQEGFELVSLTPDVSIKAQIDSGRLDFVLEIAEGYSADVLNHGSNQLKLYLNDAGLNLVFKRVNSLVSEFSQSYQQSSFAQLGLSELQQQALLKPIQLEKVDVSDKRENWGEKIGGIIPYVLFLLCLQGAMFPATDLGAGEKERGTLETLLLSPVPRYQLVLGKFLTIGLAGTISALLTVFSMAAWGIGLAQGMAISFLSEFLGQIGVIDFVLMFLMLIPVVAIFAALLLSLSIYARSFKEAQSYMGPLVMLVVVPVVLSTLPGVSLEGGWAWVPLTNVALAMKELIKGTMDYFALVAIFLSTMVIAGALLAFCVHWFSKEKVLFR